MNYSQKLMKKLFLETMEHFEFTHWLAVEERGEKNNLLHLQAIVWHKDEFIYKKACSIKSYRFNKQRLSKKSNKDVTRISFSKGLKDTLASYSSKELEEGKRFHITNLTQEEIKKIKPWVPHKKLKLNMKELAEILKKNSHKHPLLFRNIIIQEYLKVDKLPPIHTMRKLSLLYNDHYHEADYQDEVGSLRNTRFSDDLNPKFITIPNPKYDSATVNHGYK